MGKRKKGVPGVSFSWKQATGVTKAKRQISKATGIPLTRSGRQRKLGKAMGCCVPAAFLLAGGITSLYGAGKALLALIA